jgi:dTDP-glucose 4,6-dehydratase
MRRRCAVVSGGAGFLGSHLCDRLVEDGWHVVCIDDLSTGSEDNLGPVRRAAADFLLLRHDVSAPWRLEERVDAVFHLASRGRTGADRAVEVAAQHDARLVLASTSEVPDEPQGHPQPGDRLGSVDVGVVRVLHDYGPRMRRGDRRVVRAFLEQALAGQPLTIPGDGSRTTSPCYVDDVVEGLVRMGATPGEPGPVDLAGAHEVTVRELASLVARVVGVPDRVVQVPRQEQDPPGPRPDTSRARTLLGWTPTVDLEDGLARTLAWWRETQGLEPPLLA